MRAKAVAWYKNAEKKDRRIALHNPVPVTRQDCRNRPDTHHAEEARILSAFEKGNNHRCIRAFLPYSMPRGS
jgi:hypothetical protein